jgi:hypothetical protein
MILPVKLRKRSQEINEVPFAFRGRADKIVLQQFATEVDPIEELQKLSSIE